MQTKIDHYKRLVLRNLQRLNDIRFTGQIVFVVIVLLISWSGVKTIQSNYGLQKQISALKQQNDVQSLQNTNLALQNQYLNTNQYLELSARQNFGLGAAGEKEMVVPANVALAYTVNPPKAVTPTVSVPKSQHNLQSWINFFLHRNS